MKPTNPKEMDLIPSLMVLLSFTMSLPIYSMSASKSMTFENWLFTETTLSPISHRQEESKMLPINFGKQEPMTSSLPMLSSNFSTTSPQHMPISQVLRQENPLKFKVDLYIQEQQTIASPLLTVSSTLPRHFSSLSP